MSFYEKTGTKAEVQDHRRKWDITEYHIKAQERLAKEKEEIAKKNGLLKPEKTSGKKELLKMREEKIDLTSKIGKSTKVNPDTCNDGVGFYCEICDVTVKDSISYLTHCNGKSHQKNLGITMKVKKSSVNDVKARIAMKAAEKKELKRKKDSPTDYDLIDEDVDDKNMKKKKVKDEDIKEELEDEEMMKVMGFGKFSSTSKK
ncbi:Zinc finger matrin-type protein 2 [Strongyloides ratti]|uniref:Zinc finger matrin-type protein 2 n=1 Tax=Strongyloides ratti TaxID=34506 RepID=A0A090L7Y9_STRRB|nr:Zinc finger matrin-type protein 2 [Strongyloides ratti]CEF65921.1 Zinc finger matrin-type protein 2 [Strongyloides ratti]